MRTISVILLIILSLHSHAQGITDVQLDAQRVRTNKTGMMILGGWGAANIVSGIAGFATAKKDVWRGFHGMNAVWGAVNGLIALGGYMGAMKEGRHPLTGQAAYDRYISNRRLYLINAGLDVLYIGTGLVIGNAIRYNNHPNLYLGMGRSICIQGLALLIFDGAMYGIHRSQNKKWQKILGGISMTGNGISFTYHF